LAALAYGLLVGIYLGCGGNLQLSWKPWLQKQMRYQLLVFPQQQHLGQQERQWQPIIKLVLTRFKIDEFDSQLQRRRRQILKLS